MNGHDIDSIVNQAQEEQQSVTDLAQQTVDWFISDSRIGNAYPIEEATQELSQHLDVGYHEASRAISSVVGDIVDPVQLITLSDGKYVGVFEYNIYSESGAYGYIHYDDRLGKLRRVVCAKCVQDHVLDENVTHATQGMGTSNDESSWTDLVNKIENHYHNSHQTQPEDIEPGATLVSGTTISGNSVFHSGNESGISHNNISGGTTGNPHANSLSTSYTAPVQDVNGNTGSVTVSVPVDSVNGKTGTVALSAADVNALADTYSAPVQSVNSQTGDVTISTGSAIGGTVTNYSDLPLDLSERQLYYVSSEDDVVVQTDANLNTWKSISDFTTVASAIPDTSMFQSPLYQWWGAKIEASDGGTASPWDDALNSVTATAVGDPIFRTDKSGFSAAEYDATDDGHDFESDGNLPTGAANFSIAALIYYNSNGNKNVVTGYGSGGSTGARWNILVDTDDTLRVEAFGGGSIGVNGGTVSAGQWVTVGCSFSDGGSQVDLFLNGSETATNSDTADLALDDSDRNIGYASSDNSNYYDGAIAEVVYSDTTESDQSFSDYHNDRLG